MDYGWEAYQADRATMGFPVLALLAEDNIRLKRKRLALDGAKRDQAAIDAACGRLLAWVASGAAEPVPPKPKPERAAPGGKARTAQARVEAAAWQRLLADQQARHARRRSAYPDVRPTPRP